MRPELLLDTHIWLWYAIPNRCLKGAARDAIDARIMAGTGLAVSIMSIWEISMLMVKDRLHLGKPIDEWMEEALALPGLRVLPLEPKLIFDAHRLPGDFHPDPADRLIVATSRHHGLMLITEDQKILDYGRQGYLRACSSGDKEQLES